MGDAKDPETGRLADTVGGAEPGWLRCRARRRVLRRMVRALRSALCHQRGTGRHL